MTAIISTVHASESSHWYTRDGRCVETVEGAKGQPIRPDIRHARKLGLLPGVTSIIGCAAAPGLVKWKVEQAAKAAAKLSRIEDESEPAWLSRVWEHMDSLSKKDEGTAIHAAIQQSFEGKQFDSAFTDHVIGVRKILNQLDPDAEWSTEQVCVHPLGYGTRSDLKSTNILADLKSKDGPVEALREQGTYESHWQQLSATREAVELSLPNLSQRRRCVIIYVSRTHPGDAYPFEVSEDRLAKGWEMFRCLHGYWCSKNNYQPAFQP